jgi:hypothetical protein
MMFIEALKAMEACATDTVSLPLLIIPPFLWSIYTLELGSSSNNIRSCPREIRGWDGISNTAVRYQIMAEMGIGEWMS